MTGIFLKWLVPGVVTVAAGAGLALALTGPAMTSDLTTRSIAALQASDWAKVAIDGRDAFVSGTATNRAMVDAVERRLAAVQGVRAVTSDVVLAEFIRPFPFSATLHDGEVSLAGGYPDDNAHARLVAAATPATDETRLYSGASKSFEAGAAFGLQALADLDTGAISLSGTDLSISGRARSSGAFDTLSRIETAVPEGITLVALDVTPPLASPYVWTASFDGKAVNIVGDAPNTELADKLRALAPAGIPVSTALQLASGEPTGFSANTLTLLKTLLTLESGEATIRDGSVTLVGAPADADTAEAAAGIVTALGGQVMLEPVPVSDYSLAIAKSAAGLVFTGHVPDQAMLDRLAALPNADVTGLALGRGAPVRLGSALDYGLAALAHLSEGKVTIDKVGISLSGRAATPADFATLSNQLEQGAPQGLILVATELHAPIVSPYVWSATKAGTGAVTIAGYTPDAETQTLLAGQAANLAADTSTIADGAPAGFGASARKGFDILALLDAGSVTYDGTSWAIAGTASTPQQGFAADAAYSVAGLRTAGWSYEVHLPQAAPAAALQTVSPYVWRAVKAADGKVNFSGFAPSDAFREFARVRAPGADDQSALAAGAPADFGTSAAAGLDALLALDSGSLALSGDRWTLAGEAADDTARNAINDALAAKIVTMDWQISIETPVPAVPVVTPYLWAADKTSNGEVSLSGYLPTPELRASVTAKAGTVARDSLSIASGEPAGFAAEVISGLDALGHLQFGRVAFDGEGWTLAGEAASDTGRDAALAAISKDGKAADNWTVSVSVSAAAAPPSEEVPPPVVVETPDIVAIEAPSAPVPAPEAVEPSAEASVEPSAEASVEPSAEPSVEPSVEPAPPVAVDTTPPAETLAPLDLCRARVAELAARNAILFETGKSVLTTSSLAVLDELAADLAVCPDTFVHVQGHTDSSGDDVSNLTLSVSRAEAVVTELVRRGVSEDRLYAEGFGASDPIVPNDSKDNKARNRRITFAVSPKQE
jgi:outer membrane protein OmpA-like peptidoglycan-associated protein